MIGYSQVSWISFATSQVSTLSNSYFKYPFAWPQESRRDSVGKVSKKYSMTIYPSLYWDDIEFYWSISRKNRFYRYISTRISWYPWRTAECMERIVRIIYYWRENITPVTSSISRYACLEYWVISYEISSGNDKIFYWKISKLGTISWIMKKKGQAIGSKYYAASFTTASTLQTF